MLQAAQGGREHAPQVVFRKAQANDHGPVDVAIEQLQQQLPL